MTNSLPSTPRQLHWMFARRLGVAALSIGLLASGASYLLESRRAEQAALELAGTAASHFATPAMQLLLRNAVPDGHAALTHNLDRSRFIGILVFGQQGKLMYETWADVPAAFTAPIKSRTHAWPGAGESRRHWLAVDGERLIQVILPLQGDGGSVAGYLEGIYRLDPATLQHERAQMRNEALTVAAAVLATAILLYPLLLAMLKRSNHLTHRLLEANISLIRSLGNAVAKRDSDTDAHNYRVTLYAVALAEAMGVPAGEIPDLMAGAFLHDVGKIGIPDRILLKPGKLTAEEFEIMKTHARLGLDIVAGNAWMKGASVIIRHHHERFDGAGYPDGLAGEAIPRLARIFAVIDVFDALTSARPYKSALPLAEALDILAQEAGRHFDPKVVVAFKAVAPTLHARIASAPTQALARDLRPVLLRYFKTEAAPAGAASTAEGRPT